MIQSILQSLFTTTSSSLPSPAVAAETPSGCGQYKKDIRNCIDDDGDTTTSPVLGEGKNENKINDDTTVVTKSTLPPPRRRRYIKKPKRTTTDSSMLM